MKCIQCGSAGCGWDVCRFSGRTTEEYRSAQRAVNARGRNKITGGVVQMEEQHRDPLLLPRCHAGSIPAAPSFRYTVVIHWRQFSWTLRAWADMPAAIKGIAAHFGEQPVTIQIGVAQ